MQRSAGGEREDKEAPSSSTWLRRMRIRDATAPPQILRGGKPGILWHSFFKSFHLSLILRIPLRPHANRKGKKKKRRIWLSLQGSKAAKGKREGKREKKKKCCIPLKRRRGGRNFFLSSRGSLHEGKGGETFFSVPLRRRHFPFFSSPDEQIHKAVLQENKPYHISSICKFF